jgi:uncharacterized membrane protein YbhN (UPF0104 family)
MYKQRILSVLATVAIVGVGLYYYNLYKEDFHLITSVSIKAIAALVLLKVAFIFCNSYQVKILTDHYKLNLPFIQWFGLSRLTAFNNLILPSGGAASIKAMYLKKIHNLAYSSFIASTAIAHIIRLLIIGFFSSTFILFGGEIHTLLLAVSGGMFFVAFSFLLYAHRVRRFLPSWGYMEKMIDEWHLIRADHSMIKKLVFLNCIIFMISTLEVIVAFRVFSINAGILTSGVISAFAIFTGFLKLVPANLGIKEGLYMAIASMYGMGINEGFHAASLDRIVVTILTLVLALLFSHGLLKKGQ